MIEGYPQDVWKGRRIISFLCFKDGRAHGVFMIIKPPCVYGSISWVAAEGFSPSWVHSLPESEPKDQVTPKIIYYLGMLAGGNSCQSPPVNLGCDTGWAG